MLYVLIPARKGSAGVPNKNLRPLAGKSLLERAVEVARQFPAQIDISTDYEVWDLPESCQAYHFRRPVRYATPDASMSDVIIHWASARPLTHDDDVLLLQPTSLHPNRMGLIRDALAVSSRPVISVDRYPPRWHPAYALIPQCGVVHPMPTTRQSLSVRYRANGLFYLMDGRRAKEGCLWKPLPTYIETPGVINIDTEADWLEAERQYG
jgi:CMP-N,N'-diacetyllegionaminic acid synthase